MPKGWFDVFHEKQLVRPFDNVAAESDFQPARLKPVVWEDTEQDKEEFVEIRCWILIFPPATAATKSSIARSFR